LPRASYNRVFKTEF
jgi:hypothetical protein